MSNLLAQLFALSERFTHAFTRFGEANGLTIGLFLLDERPPARLHDYETMEIPTEYFPDTTWRDGWGSLSSADDAGDYSYVALAAGNGRPDDGPWPAFRSLAAEAGALCYLMPAGLAAPGAGAGPGLAWLMTLFTRLRGRADSPFLTDGPGYTRIITPLAASLSVLGELGHAVRAGRACLLPTPRRPGIPGLKGDAQFRIAPGPSRLRQPVEYEFREPDPPPTCASCLPPPAAGRFVVFRNARCNLPEHDGWLWAWAWDDPADGAFRWLPAAQVGDLPLLGCGTPPAVCTWLPAEWPGQLLPLGGTPAHWKAWIDTARAVLSRLDPTVPATDPVFGYQPLVRCTRLLARRAGMIDDAEARAVLPTTPEAAQQESLPLLDLLASGQFRVGATDGGSGQQAMAPGADAWEAPVGRFAHLLEVAARVKLKGDGLRIIEVIVKGDGRAPLSAIGAACDWLPPFTEWNSACYRLKAKLLPHGWTVYADARYGVISRIE